MPGPSITTSLVSHGLLSEANREALAAWSVELFETITQGGGESLLSSSVAGRTFTFGGHLTVSEAFENCSTALRILSGQARRRSVMRF